MEPAEAWSRPCELQLANYWTHEEQPAAGLPLEYASIDISGDCSLQAYVPESSGGQQLPDEYYYYYCSSSSLHNDDWSSAEAISHGQKRQVTEETPGKHHQVVDLQREKNEDTKVSNDSRAGPVFKQVSHAFKADIDTMEKKMHRYPASLRGLDKDYTVPRIVAIGPYHHHHPHLKQAEKVKHMAAIRCVVESGHLLEEVYGAVVSAADDVRRLYDKDVMAGIGYDDFRHMMFFDACFLVQYMLMRSGDDIDQSLHGFMSPNRIDIQHDITLLENQLPWQVVETLMRFRRVPDLRSFIVRFRNFLQDQVHEDNSPDKEITHIDDKQPHLLGLFRHDIVGTSSGDDDTNNKHSKTETEKLSFSASAMELAKIGITLKAKNTMELIRMGLEEGTLFAELSVPPLCLDRNRASYLVNMAALELCTVLSFGEAPVEDSAVCSYLLLLAMLVYKEEDVDELRARGLLEGGGGLTNQEAVRFFTSLQGLRLGKRYYLVMVEVNRYKKKRWMLTNSHARLYKNWKIICQVVSAVVVFVTIITPVFTFLPHK